MGVVFDKLGFMRKLEGEEGFTRPQAERLTDAFYDAVVESVATKQDVGDVKQDVGSVKVELKETRAELKHKVTQLRSEVKHEIAQVRPEIAVLRSEFKSEVSQLKVWAAGTGAAVVSLLAARKFFT